MGYWVLTDKYKEYLPDINCYIWDSNHFSKKSLPYDIDLHYETMLRKPLKEEMIVIDGNFKEESTLYCFNNFIESHKNRFKRVMVLNFSISNLTINSPLHFTEIDFIGKIVIYSCVFNKRLFFRDCNINNKVQMDYNYFIEAIYIDIDIGNNTIILNNNRLASWIRLPHTDNILIKNLELIDKDKKNIRFNQYFKNVIKTHFMFTKLRETYAFIKNNYQQHNNYISSNIFYALEMLARAKELEMLDRFKDRTLNEKLEFIVFNINKITSNHGQSILLPILWVIALTVLCALVQWCTNKDGFYWLGVIFFPYFPDIDYKELNRGWMNQILLFGYLFVKSISAMLWWQFIRAIRKDIKR